MSIAIDPKILKRCPADHAEAIAFLHAEGLSMIETMWVLVHHRDMRLRDAKEQVSTNPVWAEVVAATDRAIDQYLDEIEGA